MPAQPSDPGSAGRRRQSGRPAAHAESNKLVRLFLSEPELILSLVEGGNGPTATQADSILRAACRAAAIAPQDAELHYYTARAAWLAERLELAEHLLDQALKSKPQHVAALVLLGKVLHRRQAVERAIACLTTAVTSGADYPDVHAELGHLWCKTGDQSRARQAYGRALKLNPQFAAAREAMTALVAASESGC